jgi:peptidoglycan LD-endopeptidase CwlK
MAFKPTYHERNIQNIEKLADHTKVAAKKWYDYCVRNGIDILIYETLRTKEKQEEYVREGVSQTTRSYHLVGQALDFVPIVNGKADWNGYGNPKIQQAIAYAKMLGFTWGGDWKTFKDKPHLQYDKIPYGADTFGKLPELTAKAKPTKPSVIKKGDKGNQVKEVQRLLIKHGYNVKVDGIFGVETEKAVKAFQTDKGLVADGIVGEKTMAALKASPLKYRAIIKRGHNGEDVKEIQRLLVGHGYKIEVDGIFGPATQKAVKAFQKSKKLAVDGIVGPKTLAALRKF